PLTEEEAFKAFLRPLYCHDWIVYAKRPFGGPQHVLQYLARYTHRVAISNHRIVDIDDTHVVFRWKDYAHHSKRRTMRLAHEEFSTPLPTACSAEGFPAHPLLWIPRQP